MLPAAAGVAISLLPIVAVVLMLVTERGRANGPAFLAGWIAGILVAGAILLAVASSADANDEGQPADWVASLRVATPVVIYFALGERSRELLDRLRNWMAHNNAVILAVLLLVIGVKLIGDTISGLSS